MFIWMVLIGTVVTLIVIYLNKQSKSNSTTPSSTAPSPVGPTRPIPVIKKPSYPTIYDAYQKHYPIIKKAVFNAMDVMDYWQHVTPEEIDAEIVCFMFFTAVKFSTDEQKIDGESFMQELWLKMTDEEATFRLDVYDSILNQENLPRVDWGRPVSKYTFKNHEMPYLRAFCAFGDFLINPDCRQDYFNDTPMKSTYVIDSIYFQEYFGNEIFESIADYTTCFPYQVHYQK